MSAADAAVAAGLVLAAVLAMMVVSLSLSYGDRLCRKHITWSMSGDSPVTNLHMQTMTTRIFLLPLAVFVVLTTSSVVTNVVAADGVDTTTDSNVVVWPQPASMAIGSTRLSVTATSFKFTATNYNRCSAAAMHSLGRHKLTPCLLPQPNS